MGTLGLGGSGGTSSGVTPGGYPRGAGKETSKTGLWKQNPVPFLPSPVTPKEMREGQGASQYTYRQYAIPDFSNSDLIGMPSNSFTMTGGQSNIRNQPGLFNTRTELNKVAGWDTASLKGLQAEMVKRGWLSKRDITGRPTKATMSAVAFLMDQGNRLGENWQDVMGLGPDGLKRAGGVDVSGGGSGPGGGGGGPGSAGGGPVTSVSSSVNYSTKATARNYLRQALSDVLGRGPDDDELDEFVDLLRSKERKHPTVTTTVSSLSPTGDLSTTDSTSEGGFDASSAQNLAENFATDLDPKQARRYKRAGYEQMLDALVMGG